MKAGSSGLLCSFTEPQTTGVCDLNVYIPGCATREAEEPLDNRTYATVCTATHLDPVAQREANTCPYASDAKYSACLVYFVLKKKKKQTIPVVF